MSFSSSTATDIRNSLSEALRSKLEVTLGTVTSINMPTTEEEAVIALAQVNVNFNNAWMVPLSGTPLVELFLHGNQLNEALIGLCLSGLELVTASSGVITMVMPQNGITYYGAVTEVTCLVEGATAVSVFDGSDSFALSTTGGSTWSGLWAFAIGEHSITVTAECSGGPVTTDVAFTVDFWETSPQDGDTLPAGPTWFELNPLDSTDIAGVTASVDGDVIDLVFDAAEQLFRGSKDLAAGVYTVIIDVARTAAETATKTIQITLSDVGGE